MKWKKNKSIAQAKAVLEAFVKCDYEAARAISFIRHEYTDYDDHIKHTKTPQEVLRCKYEAASLIMEKLPSYSTAILTSYRKSLSRDIPKVKPKPKKIVETMKTLPSEDSLGFALAPNLMTQAYIDVHSKRPTVGQTAVFVGKKGNKYTYKYRGNSIWVRGAKHT